MNNNNNNNNNNDNNNIVVPPKSDSDVMFCLQSYQGLITDSNPTDSLLAQVEYII